MLTVAFAGTFAVRLHQPVRALLEINCDYLTGSEAEIAPRMAEVDVLVSMGFDAALGGAASRLKLLQVPGAGLERVERAALPPGAWLANTYGHEVGIAEYAIGALLSLTRAFGRLDSALRQGEWLSQWQPGREAPAPWAELAGRTLGIVGYGRIGQAVARRARAFDMTVMGIRRQPQPDQHADFVGGPGALDRVLAAADHLVIAAALNPETRGLLGARELALLPTGAVLINVGRGELVDEDALYQALANGHLGGAALDVWYRYPTGPSPTLPANQPFQELPNVLMTPHVSGWTDGMLANRARAIADNIARVARGEPPVHGVAPAG